LIVDRKKEIEPPKKMEGRRGERRLKIKEGRWKESTAVDFAKNAQQKDKSVSLKSKKDF
jgi:hypothetical protein